jgi:hypothetical protein
MRLSLCNHCPVTHTLQHLVSEEKVRIKCRDYIKKIAVYRDKIAVQLPDRVLIYQLNEPKDDNDMHYVSVAKIQRVFDCNLLVITSSHFILCQEMRLQLCVSRSNFPPLHLPTFIYILNSRSKFLLLQLRLPGQPRAGVDTGLSHSLHQSCRRCRRPRGSSCRLKRRADPQDIR